MLKQNQRRAEKGENWTQASEELVYPEGKTQAFYYKDLKEAQINKQQAAANAEEVKKIAEQLSGISLDGLIADALSALPMLPPIQLASLDGNNEAKQALAVAIAGSRLPDGTIPRGPVKLRFVDTGNHTDVFEIAVGDNVLPLYLKVSREDSVGLTTKKYTEFDDTAAPKAFYIGKGFVIQGNIGAMLREQLTNALTEQLLASLGHENPQQYDTAAVVDTFIVTTVEAYKALLDETEKAGKKAGLSIINVIEGSSILDNIALNTDSQKGFVLLVPDKGSLTSDSEDIMSPDRLEQILHQEIEQLLNQQKQAVNASGQTVTATANLAGVATAVQPAEIRNIAGSIEASMQLNRAYASVIASFKEIAAREMKEKIVIVLNRDLLPDAFDLGSAVSGLPANCRVMFPNLTSDEKAVVKELVGEENMGKIIFVDGTITANAVGKQTRVVVVTPRDENLIDISVPGAITATYDKPVKEDQIISIRQILSELISKLENTKKTIIEIKAIVEGVGIEIISQINIFRGKLAEIYTSA